MNQELNSRSSTRMPRRFGFASCISSKKLFGADLRSLAVMRICMAVIISRRPPTTFMGPRCALHRFRSSPTSGIHRKWLHALASLHSPRERQLGGKVVLFGIAAIFALLLLVGYQTRRATIVCWFFLLSVRNRNTLIWADALLSDVLFWGMFLPWGARFSVDKVLHRAYDKLPDRYLSWGTAIYVMQIAFVFWFGALGSPAPKKDSGQEAYPKPGVILYPRRSGHPRAETFPEQDVK